MDERLIDQMAEDVHNNKIEARELVINYYDLKEKVQELEAENESLRTRRDHLAHRLKIRREENQCYKEVLEFYSNEINYQVFIKNGKSNIEHDGGEKARQALKGESE